MLTQMNKARNTANTTYTNACKNTTKTKATTKKQLLGYFVLYSIMTFLNYEYWAPWAPWWRF